MTQKVHFAQTFDAKPCNPDRSDKSDKLAHRGDRELGGTHLRRTRCEAPI